MSLRILLRFLLTGLGFLALLVALAVFFRHHILNSVPEYSELFAVFFCECSGF